MSKHIAVDDSLLPEKCVQVVAAIREYSHELDVEWIPPRGRKPGQAAFRIIHKPIGGEPYPIFTVKTEDEMDTRVLKRIIHGDSSVNGKPQYSELEAAEKAAQLVAFQVYRDQMAEAEEMAQALIKTDKTTYKFNKNLIFRDDTPGNIASKPKVF